MTNVILVDDHAIARMGFRMLLADADIEVVGEAGDGEQACQLYVQLMPDRVPDVVVMDLSTPGGYCMPVRWAIWPNTARQTI